MSTRLLQNILILSLLAPCIEVDISVPSFPDISDYFGISDGMTQMTIAYNLYGMVLACLFQGPLSDRYGRRRMMIIGNGIMVLGALGCSMAWSIEFLYASRFVQGIGASASMVLTTTIIADKFKAKDAAKLYGLLASILTILMSLAPIVGSFINELVGWRGNYSIVAAISIVSWVFLFFKLPETLPKATAINVRKTIKDYLKIYTTKRFLSASMIPSLNYAGHLSFITVASFLYMETYDLHIAEYAFHQAFVVASFSIMSMNTGASIQRIGEVETMYTGVALCFLGGALMSILAIMETQSPYVVTLTMMIYAMGCALSRNVPFAKAMECFPQIKGTTASALITLRMVVVSTVVSIVGMLYAGELILISSVLLINATIMILLAMHVRRSFSF